MSSESTVVALGGRITHIFCKDMSVRYAGNAKRAVSNHISFEVKSGEILAIMGPSGAGKSTLIKGLLGRAPHVTGEIRVNGENYSSKGGLASLSHRVGLVPQSDVLVDELSMVENIHFFHRIAVDTPYTNKELDARITASLLSLGLMDDPKVKPSKRLTRKHIGDGSGTKNQISGGQAKRANIAMELVNNPDVLIIDEPTSGLSSHDSLALLEQLREIANSGKIVIVIIHQPSSDIFRLFDRLMVLDGVGNCVRSGPRDEVARWLETQKLASGHFGCDACGNYFPDQILSTIEAKKDMEGKSNWTIEAEKFSGGFSYSAGNAPASPIAAKSVLRPWQALLDIKALLHRHFRVKMRDRMSMGVTFLAPPLLGMLFAIVFMATPEGAPYSFAANTRFPQLLFMLIVCTMFLGLVNSAVEVIKDRPMLERESGRGLRMWAYYLTKFTALMGFGAMQVGLLTIAAMSMIDAPHLIATNLLMLMLVMCFSVALGLLISTLCDTPTKAFNLVPLLLLPQIVLGGALLPYRDMGTSLYLWESRDSSAQPLLAKVIPASWAYQLGMRMNFDAQQTASAKDKNSALLGMQQIKAGGFLALQAQRLLVDNPLRLTGMAAPTLWEDMQEERYGADALVLLLFTGSALVLGWAWVGGRYRNGRGTAWINGATLLGVGTSAVLLFHGLTDLAPIRPAVRSTAPSGLSTPFPPAPLPWRQALAYCAQRQSSLADLDSMLAAYKANRKTLNKAAYWIATDIGAPALQIDVRQLDSLSDAQLVPHFVSLLHKVYYPSFNPKETKRFVCL